MEEFKWYTLPLPMLPTRVWRTYQGGAMIDAWRGAQGAQDGHTPEDWIASTVPAVNVGREVENEGLSRVDGAALGLSESPLLAELVAAYPQQMLGKWQVEKFGERPAILVKALDAAERLSIQVHPTREDAELHFGSPFGKTEAWYVLDTRPGEEAYVLLGFRENMTRAKWRRLFEKQDIAGMQEALHRFPVKKGDVFLVPGGVPHAIGPGCFMIEIQEPTDYTLRPERTSPSGVPLSDELCHRGLGFEGMLSLFEYKFSKREKVLERFYREHDEGAYHGSSSLYTLIGEESTDRFRMDGVVLHDEHAFKPTGYFRIVIVQSGEGELTTSEGGRLPLKQGDTLFFPAGMSTVKAVGQGMKMIICRPPRV